MATRGQRRQIVAFENPGTPVPDGEGGYTSTWVALVPALWYVSIRPASAKEQGMGGTVLTHASHIVEGDFHPGVTTATRMNFGGHVYQVTSVLNTDMQNKTMQLVADLQT